MTEASPTTTESTSTRTMPLYRVLLHNDPVNTMEHVVTTLVQIFGLQIEAAIQIMLEAHNSEVALCKVEPLEPAELHRDQLQAAGLTATVEKES